MSTIHDALQKAQNSRDIPYQTYGPVLSGRSPERSFPKRRAALWLGILILVSLLEHRVQVLADSGINARVAPGTWDKIVQIVLDGIRGKDLCRGLCEAIEQCGEILSKEFPVQPDDINELPNRLHQE